MDEKNKQTEAQEKEKHLDKEGELDARRKMWEKG